MKKTRRFFPSGPTDPFRPGGCRFARFASCVFDVPSARESSSGLEIRRIFCNFVAEACVRVCGCGDCPEHGSEKVHIAVVARGLSVDHGRCGVCVAFVPLFGANARVRLGSRMPCVRNPLRACPSGVRRRSRSDVEGSVLRRSPQHRNRTLRRRVARRERSAVRGADVAALSGGRAGRTAVGAEIPQGTDRTTGGPHTAVVRRGRGASCSAGIGLKRFEDGAFGWTLGR